MPDDIGVPTDKPHEISVVIPVYQGEKTLGDLMREILPLTEVQHSAANYPFVVRETLLVFDNGPDDSARVIRELVEQYSWVRAVWLSKNSGQHAATLAGMASAGSEWIVTLDEDGQHDPAEMGSLLDAALDEQATVVYAKPLNPPPHGLLRNTASKGAKWLLTKLVGGKAGNYQSYRLVLGSVGRSVAAYSGSGVYLDVALSWIAGHVATAPVTLRQEGDRPSGYSVRRLFGHFWRMVLTSGTRALRIVSFIGILFAVVGIFVALYILAARLTTSAVPDGWASTIVVVLLGTGAILFSLGVIAEYIGINVNMAMGKPPYLITTDPAFGPLGRAHRRNALAHEPAPSPNVTIASPTAAVVTEDPHVLDPDSVPSRTEPTA
ncbi:glycosyltransferase [Subtercola sp. PAMC28395]|uniref:glycosyltransferase n=1 Tax=Subtercola sp. PAMC28395 TaxID=2846775 RepID=UPI00209AFA87|nr:glycosyltransferase [Subtercola sp. PAMC28395]